MKLTDQDWDSRLSDSLVFLHPRRELDGEQFDLDQKESLD